MTSLNPIHPVGRQIAESVLLHSKATKKEAMEGVKQHFTVKKARGRAATLYAVDGVDLSIGRGETLGLVGESGCGKSTLGKTLLRLYPLTAGTITFDGEDISHLKGSALRRFRCQSQMIFQDPSSCLNPRRQIAQILTEPFVIHKLYTPEQRKDKILELCDRVGLSHSYLERYPHEHIERSAAAEKLYAEAGAFYLCCLGAHRPAGPGAGPLQSHHRPEHLHADT